ncbi:MAG: alpha/beta hydrolase [Chitinophagaceae bacterium]|jgi:acetyl esterase/lipase|nr:alpha/beta hydrolase [Chitinophagaceae bacterium]
MSKDEPASAGFFIFLKNTQLYKSCMKILMIALSSIIFFTSCQREESDTETTPAKEQTLTNISYGTDARQNMDIYLPANRSASSTNVIILIHGGAWLEGDKSDFAGYITTLKQRLPGYAIFNINYRLAINNLNPFPAQEMDVKQAIEFINGKTGEYAVSKNFALLGASAGGHLALLHAYKYESPVKIKAVVDFFGPTDLIALYNISPNPLIKPLLESITGGTPSTRAEVYEQASPVNFITAQAPPTLILQGGLDVVVDASQSVLLKNALQQAGVQHQYVFYSMEGHGWTGANLTDSFEKIEAFLKAYMP